MNINYAEDYCRLWDMWESGRSEGFAIAILMAEEQMRHEGTNSDQREALENLRASLLDAKLRRIPQ
jgi:hypothetical protein